MQKLFPIPAINQNDLAIIERTDYASQAISKGAFVYWNGKLRTAKNAILQGATLSASLFDDVNSAGALNQLSDHIAKLAGLEIQCGDASGNGSFTINTSGFKYIEFTCARAGQSFGKWYWEAVSNAVGEIHGSTAFSVSLSNGVITVQNTSATAFSYFVMKSKFS